MTLEEFRAEFCLPFTIFYDRHTPHVPLPQLEDWFHSRFRQVAGFGLRAAACARVPRVLPGAASCARFFSARCTANISPCNAASPALAPILDKPYADVWDKRKKIHEILAENRLAPDETLFIGDMQHDIETARHGGIHSCAVLTGYNTLEQSRAAEPDLIVEHSANCAACWSRTIFTSKPAANISRKRHPPLATVGALIFNGAGEVLMIRTHKWSESVGHSRRQNQMGRTLRSRAAPRNQGGDQPRRDGH